MKYTFAIVLISIVWCATAQSRAGVTNKIDTSYSTYSAYINSIKTHPEARIVQEFLGLNIVQKRNIAFLKTEEQTLHLDAFYPTNLSNCKTIVIVHGGGWRTGNRQQHIPLAQKLASLGYACFTVEYRLSTHALFPAAVKDVKYAIKWIKEQQLAFPIDTSKVAIVGFSAGGQLAALIGSTNQNSFFEHDSPKSKASSSVQAIVDLDGILAFIHPESGEGDDSKSTSAATYWFGYSKTQNPDLWKKGSALTYAGVATPPTLFINSSIERMHAGRTDYINELTKHSIYTEVKTFENSPHSFVLFEPWFTPMVETIDTFLEKALK